MAINPSNRKRYGKVSPPHVSKPIRLSMQQSFGGTSKITGHADGNCPHGLLLRLA